MWSPFSFKRSYRSNKIKPTVLLIMDGWGVAPPSAGNGIEQAKTPNLKRFFAEYLYTELIASGESVGLPANEVGNTEVGHLTLGSGRVTYQGLKRINLSIEDGQFYQNKAFNQAIDHVKQHNSKLHLIGILTTGNVHASLPHFLALLELCKHSGLTTENVCVHAFTDGRDAPPKQAAELFPQIFKKMQDLKIGKFATIGGRYYGMDRDRRWERIQRAYEAMVEGKGTTANSYLEAIENSYKKGVNDEMIEPTVILENNQPVGTMNDNDAMIYFNFRIDRPKELTMALTVPDFEHLDAATYGYKEEEDKRAGVVSSQGTFQRGKIIQNLFSVTMMNYQKSIPVSAVAFDTPVINNPLGEVIATQGLAQLHQAESEKERFVTYYFDGFREQPFDKEEYIIVPSPKVPSYDKKPEMSLAQQVKIFKRSLGKDKYGFGVFACSMPLPADGGATPQPSMINNTVGLILFERYDRLNEKGLHIVTFL